MESFAGLNFAPNAKFFREGKDSPYVNWVVVRTENKDDVVVNKLKKAYQSKESLPSRKMESFAGLNFAPNAKFVLIAAAFTSLSCRKIPFSVKAKIRLM
jgi:hypothetical protein